MSGSANLQLTANLPKWDKETDVVVIGYGYAGGASAIAAHDAGVNVLILEKMQHPGGCSILSYGGIASATNEEDAVKLLTRLSMGTVGPDVIQAFAQGLCELPKYFEEILRNSGVKLRDPTSLRIYEELPGINCISALSVGDVPGFAGFPWLSEVGKRAGARLMKVVMDNVDSRRIEVMLETPARKLVTDCSGAVIGVIAENTQRTFTIKARRGVILACGGFEHNDWLKLQYLDAQPFYSVAPLGNTGDGIIMAQEVGAALWHMWHVHGSYGFKFPEFPIAFRFSLYGSRQADQRVAWINVDRFGKRFMNEIPAAPQDMAHRPLHYYDADIQDYPRIPCYLIFDEAGRMLGPIAQPIFSNKEDEYEWSVDNSAEVKRGWILKASTIRELATKLKMEPAVLEDTVAAWNMSCEKNDSQFHRPPGTMMPIKSSPFYAITAWPIISNTQGGPQHNEKQQVVGADRNPIPRLYAAGELGSFFGHLYILCGNIGECFIGGRIAGRNAAAEKNW